MAVQSQSNGGDVPIVNGHPLDSLDNVEKALSYLTEGYNDGDLSRRKDAITGKDTIIVTARRGQFSHTCRLLDAHRLGVIDISNFYGRGGKQVIEITEV